VSGFSAISSIELPSQHGEREEERHADHRRKAPRRTGDVRPESKASCCTPVERTLSVSGLGAGHLAAGRGSSAARLRALGHPDSVAFFGALLAGVCAESTEGRREGAVAGEEGDAGLAEDGAVCAELDALGEVAVPLGCAVVGAGCALGQAVADQVDGLLVALGDKWHGFLLKTTFAFPSA
jgi:hypothetical protein